MITLEQKKEIVTNLIPRIERATGLYLVDFEGVNVEEANAFRAELREKEVEYQVVKNTLIRKALDSVEGKDLPQDKLKGQSGLVITYDDPTIPSKIIKKIYDKTEKLALKAALIDGQVFDGSQLDQVAALQSKDDLIASIMGSLSAPVSGIAGSMGALIRDIASMVEEVAKKQNAA